MYCKKCGILNDDKLNFCVNCGNKLKETASEHSTGINRIWYGVLGFIVPILGLIFYVAYKDDNPKISKTSFKGAVLGLALPIISSVIVLLLYVLLALLISMKL